jgi:phage tail sheath protein FI
VPPCGHIAGIYARISRTVGVHKPPANEQISTAQDVQTTLTNDEYGFLNDNSVNVIRAFPGRGLRVAGARTLASDSLEQTPELRYVNIRRLLLMIEESIAEQLNWLVFEPNTPILWEDIERIVGGFLTRLWRLGMLDGATPDDAFYVRCDESTNPPEQVDQGRLLCEIGIRPPWPAEFIVVRIGITEGRVVVLGEITLEQSEQVLVLTGI